VNNLILACRRPLIVVLELGLVALSNHFAFWLRFDGAVPPWALESELRMLPWLVAVRAVAFVPFRLYEGLWRYTGIWELRNIVAAVVFSSIAFYLLVSLQSNLAYPRSVYFTDAVLLICMLSGLRLSYRLYRDTVPSGRRTQKRVLIFGAGDAGEMILRDMRQYAGYTPIGFIDDDRGKVGHHIHGVAVLGTRDNLPAIMATHRPHEVLIAIPSVQGTIVRELMAALEPFDVSIRTLPNIRELLEGSVSVSQIRDLSIEDLLARTPVGLDPDRVRQLLRGKRVLITGAGGSIGSELCRQVAAMHPGMLVLYERYENSLYEIANDLSDRGHGPLVRPVIGDVTDAARLDAVFAEHSPEIVFHAAAHKHVPLMELNAGEAVKNNIIGTRMVAEAAARHRVERFIMISTDKAVNPTSVMGATKRVAELTVQALASRSWTSFVTVRFGNVLGSNGSVVPRFREQIAAGGPVTVTHPEIRRFFMLIPEAVQLVLHAAAIGTPGAVYVLEMGDQIKLVDMARNLIRLSGFLPDEEIPITFVGLRPGEKLFEELVGADEAVSASPVKKILQVEQRQPCDAAMLTLATRGLEQQALRGDTDGVLEQLRAIIPTFRLSAGLNAEPLSTNAKLSEDFFNVMERSAAAGARSPRQAHCPSCGCSRLHRRRTRFAHERLRKKLSDRRPHQCGACGWRGWIEPIVDTPHDSALPTAQADLDFNALDVALTTSQRLHGQIVERSSVRDLDSLGDGTPAEIRPA
jgi:FlaA1/EpsC-like NDP-sugar epimerase